MSGVSTICFAASYAVALALEISRLLFRSGVRGACHAGLRRGRTGGPYRVPLLPGRQRRRAPLSSEKDWYPGGRLGCWWWSTCIWPFFRPKVPFGLFLLPLALALDRRGHVSGQRPTVGPRAGRREFWGAIHGISILLAAVAVLVGFVAGLMYLGQVAAPETQDRRPPRGLRLPSLEWLQRANSRAIVVSVLMLGVGMFSGMVLNLINAGNAADRLPWTIRWS